MTGVENDVEARGPAALPRFFFFVLIAADPSAVDDGAMTSAVTSAKGSLKPEASPAGRHAADTT